MHEWCCHGYREQIFQALNEDKDRAKKELYKVR